MKRQRAHLSARAAVEEDMMQRVQLSKEERRRLKGARRSALSGGAMLDDFADDVAGIVQARSFLAPCLSMLQWSRQFSGAGVDGEEPALRHGLSYLHPTQESIVSYLPEDTCGWML